jgi:glycosyltransferase involved in cell wall biosynthesis
MPEISVIVPSYNAENTIYNTINSVSQQTFIDLEILVIDDGSTDSTLEIVSTIKDPRLQVFSYANSGVAITRNRGIEKATGKYIAFLDADDLWMPNKLKFQREALQNLPEAAVAYSWSNYINEWGRFSHIGQRCQFQGNVYPHLLVNNFLESGSNPLIRKLAIQKTGGFETSLVPAEDWDFYLRLAASYEFVHVPEVHVLYRISTQAASANTTKMEAKCLEVIEKAFQQAPNTLQYLKKKSIENLYTYLLFRTLEGKKNRQKSKVAVRYLWKAIASNPTLLYNRSKVMTIVIAKIVVGLLMP